MDVRKNLQSHFVHLANGSSTVSS